MQNNTELILTILVGIIAAGALVQMIVLVVVALALKKGAKLAGAYATEMQSKVVPVLEHSKALIQTTRELITRLEPKLEAAATNLADISQRASAEAKNIQDSTDEITERVRRQAARVDGMTTSALNGVDRAGHILNQAVSIPVRQISGVVAAARAVFDTLRKPSPRGRTSA